jgi:hypothetical protein
MVKRADVKILKTGYGNSFKLMLSGLGYQVLNRVVKASLYCVIVGALFARNFFLTRFNRRGFLGPTYRV